MAHQTFHPPFKPPPGATASLSIIDSTATISNMATSVLMKPPMPGLSTLPTLPAWSFLIESSTGQRALFDLGIPPDWAETDKGGFTPAIIKRLRENGWDVRAQKGVVEVLEEGGVERGSVGSVVWSHWHWDHIGNPSTFPSTTEIVVGPGFQEAFSPYYPEKPDSPIKASYFKTNPLREITSFPLTIGPFPAHDFFSDGSFYLLSTPGHAIGHLAGLIRTTTTTSPPTFVLLGGDLCHHAGELRPSPFLPLPSSISLTHLPSSASLLHKFPYATCPGTELEALQHRRGRAKDEPFFEPAMGHDVPLAIETIEKTWGLDAREDVFFIFAHDAKVKGVVDFFPKRMNAWKEEGWREKVLWRFVEDFDGALVGGGSGKEGKI